MLEQDRTRLIRWRKEGEERPIDEVIDTTDTKQLVDMGHVIDAEIKEATEYLISASIT